MFLWDTARNRQSYKGQNPKMSNAICKCENQDQGKRIDRKLCWKQLTQYGIVFSKDDCNDL
jgi:hypothetical protein